MASAALDLIIKLQGTAKAQQDFSNLAGKVDEVGAATDRTQGRLSLLAKGGLLAAGGGILALGAGIGKAVSSGLSFNSTLEQTTAKMVAFTGSQEGAAKVLEMVRDRAAKTPFAFGEMADAAAALLPVSKQSGVALEAMVEQAEVLAALNPAEGLAGAAFALREAAGGDFLSIVERFNLPKQRLQELKAEGIPALEAVTIAMKEMGVDTSLVAGLAETASGRWSTFSDTLQGLAATATGEIFESFSAGLGDVNKLLEANGPAIEAFATTIGQGLGQALIAAVNGVQQFMAAITPVVTFIADNWKPILMGLIPVVGAFLPAAFAALSLAAGTAAATVTAALAPITLPIAAIGAALALLTVAWTRDWGGIRTTITTWWNQTGQPIFTSLRTWLADTLTKAISSLATFWTNTLQPALKTVWEYLNTNILPIFKSLYEVYIATLKTEIGLLTTAWNNLKPALIAVWEFLNTSIVPIIKGLYEVHVAALKVGLEALKLAWELLKPALEAAWTFMSTNIVPIFEKAGTVVIPAVSTAITAIGTAWNAVSGPLGTAAEFIGGAATTAFNTFARALDSVAGWLDDIADFLDSLPDSLPGWLTGGGGGVGPPKNSPIFNDAPPPPGGAAGTLAGTAQRMVGRYLISGFDYGPGHPGVDLGAAQGTPIRAWKPLNVFAGEGAIEGNYALATDNRGFTYYLGHGSRKFDSGFVPAGAVFGNVGMTGKATGPHIHFEVRSGGRSLNPHTHAYADGGWITEPVVGVGMRSGDRYTLAERGPEYVSPGGSNIQITINAAPGMDERVIAQRVVQELDRRERLMKVR